ncbi:glycosyltransferase family 2 protein [Lacticaseibacillus pabuli]|uniref:Glycosyltransferase family 2 protein n=1 Tax=Lacticaseibacillus pabuli TaxID=3025672 RepID=A0ABY7WS16_9LACO|nr:glycosyltransferase family 2 protein [Lacticaseibacillus sp. KACC 23028]WDF82526.1 glycosyltransferase family 2 protein [Lacticaseibacillus sp. KACC 23028]
MQTLVSVIIPVYNLAEHLTRSLVSVASQTYTNLQVILVDDGSSDESRLRMDAFARADRRFTVLAHQGNRGVSSARNTGLAIARGKYVAFVDGDDWLEPDYIAHFVQDMDQGEYDLVVNPYIIEKTAAKEPADRHLMSRPLTRRQFLDGVRSPLGLVRGYLWNKMYRLDIIRRHHLRFDPDISMMEDELFTVQYAVYADTFYYGGNADYHYCINPNSATHGESPVKLLPQQIVSLHRVNRVIATIGRDRSFPEKETEA